MKQSVERMKKAGITDNNGKLIKQGKIFRQQQMMRPGGFGLGAVNGVNKMPIHVPGGKLPPLARFGRDVHARFNPTNMNHGR